MDPNIGDEPEKQQNKDKIIKLCSTTVLFLNVYFIWSVVWLMGSVFIIYLKIPISYIF